MEVAHIHIERHIKENGGKTSSVFTPTVSHSTSSLQDFASVNHFRCSKVYSRSATNSVEEQDEDSETEEGANFSDTETDEATNSTEKKGVLRDADGRKKLTRGTQPEIVPGIFYGLAKHSDGSLIPVKIEVSVFDYALFYYIKKIYSKDGEIKI